MKIDMREHIKTRSALALNFAEDGAYFSAARILQELTDDIKAHAEYRNEMLEKMINKG